MCAVQKVIGPMGSNPDYYREADRKCICDAMYRITKNFRKKAFADGQRIWIFKYAETIMFLPLLKRVWGDRFRFILNVRNPTCQHTFGIWERLETLECFHLRRDIIWDTLVVVDSQFSPTNPLRNDLFHAVTFHDMMMPTWNWLHQMMSEQFVIVRHEDLLTEKGVERFAYNVEQLLNVETVGNSKEIAAKMSGLSKACIVKPIPQSKNREINRVMRLFNYTATYYNIKTLLEEPNLNT